MDSIREFMVSSSGLAPVRRGLGLGWVISVLSGVAILLGARGAEAEACPSSYDCSFNNDCSIKDPKNPIRCCYRTFKEKDGGGCELASENCVCTL